MGGENILAGRTFDNAVNMYIPDNVFTTDEEYGWIDSHSAMHSNIKVWNNYILPYLAAHTLNGKR